MASKMFSLDKADGLKILEALGFSLVSSILAALIALLALPSLELPMWVVPLVPIINGVLYTLKRFVDGQAR
jgi:ABC-type long-subunit fatty acid transport system fused permease/ATPase subunit